MTGPTIYGVVNPRFPAHWEACSMSTDEACALFFRCRGVPTDFGVPTRAVIWTDAADIIRGAVAHFHNGKAAILRLAVNRGWSTTFVDVAA